MKIEVLKSFENKRGILKKHFILGNKKYIAQEDHAFLALMTYYNIQSKQTIDQIYRESKIEIDPMDFHAIVGNGITFIQTPEAMKNFPLMNEILHSMQNDQWRAVRRGKLFTTIFEFETLDHFKPIPGKEVLCDEEYIRQYSKDFYECCYLSYADSNGRVMLTDNLRVIISRQVRNELAKFGWEFDYEEVISVIVNEDLIAALIELFPEVAQLALDIANFIWFSKGDKHPFHGSEMEKVMARNTIRVFEEAIGYDDAEAFREVDTSNAFDNTIPDEKEVEAGKRQYMLEKIKHYIVDTEALNGNIIYVEDEDIIDCASEILSWYYQVKHISM